MMDHIANLFKKKPKRTKLKVSHRRAESDMDYNYRKHQEQEEIDRILDKLKHSGYSSLSADEKRSCSMPAKIRE